MNEEAKTPSDSEFTSNFLDYIYVIVKRRWNIFWIVVPVVAVTMIISLIMPKTFVSSGTIMPPVQEKGLGLSSLMGALPLSGLAGLGEESSKALSFIAILQSRTVMANAVKKFNLDERWDTNFFEDAIKKLRKKTVFELRDEGTISVQAGLSTGWLSTDEEESEASRLAAELANFFIAELDRMNKLQSSQWARNNRIFIEGRYNEALSLLDSLEDKMKAFMEENSTPALEEQTAAAIESAAKLKSEIALAEVELGALESSVGGNHPEVKKLRERKKGLEVQLNLLKYGDNSDSLSTERSITIFPPFKDVPQLGVELLRLERELEVQGQIFQFITEQYEQARIQEVKDTPTLQVLDYAVPHKRRASPQRALLTIMVFVLATILAVTYAFVAELVSHLTSTDPRSKTVVNNIKGHIKEDLRLLDKDKGSKGSRL